jgi:hypothetical protein
VLIYELVVGQVPFIADTPFSIIHDHIYSPLPLPRTLNPNVPESIERLLLKALAKDRNDRFETVEEMVAAFKAAIQGKPLPDEWVDPATYVPPETLKIETSTPPPTPPPATVAPDKRKTLKERLPRRWWLVFPIGIGFCLCGLVALSVINNQNQGEPTEVAFTPGEVVVDGGNRPPLPDENDLPALQQALDDAIRNVEENPQDAFAYLDLANAYLDLGDVGKASEEIANGERYAENDISYFEVAGDMFATREIWLPALEMYLKAVTLSGGGQLTGLAGKFRQALYNASIDPGVESLLFDTERREFRTNFAEVIVPTARARFTLYHRDPNDALAMIEAVLDAYPDAPEARLVKAEALIMLDRPDEAEEILSALAEEELAPWLKVEVRRLLTQIQ